MAPGKNLLRLLTLALGLFFAGCSSSSSDDSNSILSVVQDLTADPDGLVTVLTFQGNLPATLGPGNFTADGGQIATGVVIAGATATVTWDSRVTPSHSVGATGFDTSAAVVAVTTTDANAPTFTIPSAVQNPGLGGDTITLQFSGARVVESAAEDINNWVLLVNGTAMDLTGSTFDLVPATQVLTATLGTGANLHASFSLAPTADVVSVADVALSTTATVGAATGDTTPPVLVSAVQDLTASQFGFVVNFTFSEAMDPVFSRMLFSFDAGFPVFAAQVDQISDAVLQVTFTEPIIPGLDSVALSSLMDAHGNAFANASTPIAAGSTVANGFDGGGPAVETVANTGGDTITATLVQAIDPATATEPGRWLLESPTGNPISLTNATITYDLMTKAVTLVLTDDDLITGDSFTFGSSGPGTGGLDIDGQAFTTVVAGTVTGDNVAATVASVLQNRQLDPTGLTYDVSFSEDVDATQAQMAANYTFTGGATVSTATLLGGLDVVRLTLSAVEVPGSDTLTVAGVVDLAGNAMAPSAGNLITSSDTTSPSLVSASAAALAGEDNDTVTVVFDDNMIASEITNLANWTVESPMGSAITPLMGTVTYNDNLKTATLVLDGGDDRNFQNDEDFSVSFLTARDIAGNVVSGTPMTGAIQPELGIPTVESVWVEDAPNNTNVHVRLSEAASEYDVMSGLTQYVVRDSMGFDVGGGTPTVVVDADKQGATLSFALAIVPASHTLDVRGITDLAGNQMFPVSQHVISAEDSTGPALDPGLSLFNAVSGEDNDVLTITFDRAVSAWNLFDPANYTLTDGVTPADFTSAQFAFDGDRVVTVTFDNGYAFGTGPYTLTVQNVTSAQGIAMAGASMDTLAADPATDVTVPAPVVGRTRLDAQSSSDTVLVNFDEAVDPSEATTLANYMLAGVTAPTTASLVGPRTAQLTWAGGVTVGQMLDITMTDLAQNAAGLVSMAITTVDTNGPAVSSVAGSAVAGVGGDLITVTFNQAVNATALVPTNYTITVNSSPLDLSGATFTYHSSTTAVTIALPSTFDFQVGDTINAVVSNILNHAGLAMSPPANVNGTVGGDIVTAPAFDAAFVNYRENALGTVVDVRFSEDVKGAFATTPANFTVLDAMSMPSTTTVVSVTQLQDHMVRLTLSAPLVAGESLETTALPDIAGNLSGTITIAPTL